jgi:hypothetical protein
MRLAVLTALVVGLVAATATASPAPTIKQTSIAGAKLGLRAKAYKKLFGKPVRKDVLRFPKDWTRLVFTKRRISVYLNPKGRAVIVTTWNKKDRTAEGIGPCSSIEEAKATYGSRFQPTESGTIGDHDFDPSNDRTYSYTVGKLMFAATGRDPVPGPSKHVTAVGLYKGAQAMANFLVGQEETSAIHCS